MHRARSRVRYTHSEPWRTEKTDPRSVPAATPRCPDKRRKFKVQGRKYVVSQNIRITAVVFIVAVFTPFMLDVRLVDVPAGVTQEEGQKRFLIRLPSPVLALMFLARRIQPLFSLADREVIFCVLTN